MISEHIEKIKSEYTDKYVAVDTDQPELARFKDHVGQVKTVNMSGRALVEFTDFNRNTGWHDIDLDYLKVVDKPRPKEKKPVAKKPVARKPVAKKPAAAAGKKKLSPLEMARMQGSAKSGGAAAEKKPEKKPAAAGKLSVADILAAARGGTAKPTAEKPAAKTEPAKVDRSQMSVADILAAARGGAAKTTKAETPPAEAPEPAVAPPAEQAEATAPEPSATTGPVAVDRSSMSVDDMLAYCREHDA